MADSLSQREIHFLYYLGKAGLTQREIAAKAGCSQSTVNKYLTALRDKVATDKQTEATKPKRGRPRKVQV